MTDFVNYLVTLVTSVYLELFDLFGGEVSISFFFAFAFVLLALLIAFIYLFAIVPKFFAWIVKQFGGMFK